MDLLERVDSALAKTNGRRIGTGELFVLMFGSAKSMNDSERQKHFRSLLNLAKRGYPGAMAQEPSRRRMFGKMVDVVSYKWLRATPEELAAWTPPTLATPPAGPSVALDDRLRKVEEALYKLVEEEADVDTEDPSSIAAKLDWLTTVVYKLAAHANVDITEIAE